VGKAADAGVGNNKGKKAADVKTNSAANKRRAFIISPVTLQIRGRTTVLL
jgi:hypothetical protein